MLPESIADIFIPGTKAMAAMHSMLGQSMEIVIHKISTPINIPITCMAAAESPFGAGRYLKNKIKTKEMAIIIARFFEFSAVCFKINSLY